MESHRPGAMKIHDDVRAVFRVGRDIGVPEIVPPITEKEAPKWLYNVWLEAETALSESQVWVVVGYSLPSYDEAVRDLIGRAARRARSQRIFICDPFSDQLRLRWAEVTGCDDVQSLPGLPDLLNTIGWSK